ncbi:MAG: 5'-methylthioadenosine/adenosylhomocysteine nucleosidase [bacterium]
MIAIVCAMENELAFYKLKLENLITVTHSNQEFLTGDLSGKKVVLTKCGIGKVNSAVITTILIQNFKPSVIINTGIAGGVKPLQTGDIFIANNFVYGDFNLEVFGYAKGQVPGMEQFFESSSKHSSLFKEYLNSTNVSFKDGLVVTQDSFITSLSQLNGLSDKLIASDMEGASMAHTCKLFDIPFLSIRIISDVIDNEKQIDNYQEFEDEAAKLSSKITYKFLRDSKI